MRETYSLSEILSQDLKHYYSVYFNQYGLLQIILLFLI